MELDKKTTILFSQRLHEQLAGIARQRGVSLGYLVREACVSQYGLVPTEERRAAVDELEALDLPVGTPEEMADESVPAPEELLP